MQADSHTLLVEHWFGAEFERLHPLLQSLHRHGGVLRGPVVITQGPGLGRWLCRIATRRLGLLPAPAQNQLEVNVVVDGTGVRWSRSFNSEAPLRSLFIPIGHFPTGYWKENSGQVSADLGVELRDGDWHWMPRAFRFRGWLLPSWLAPKVQASKGIVNGRYEFAVRISLPIVGPVLSYRGSLHAVPFAESREHQKTSHSSLS